MKTTKTVYISIATQKMYNREITKAIDKHSVKYSIKRNLIKAIIQAESNFNIFANRIENHLKKVSWYQRALMGLKIITDWHYCSFGLMQVMYANCRAYGFVGDAFSLFNPDLAIKYGCIVLRSQLRRYKGNIEHAVAAYNQGNNRYYDINKNGIKDENEVYYNQFYVDKVMKYYFKFNKMEDDHEE